MLTDENGEPWFVAKDVAKILGYRDAANMTRRLEEDEKGTRSVSTHGGEQQMAVITEPSFTPRFSAPASPKPANSSAG